MGDTDPPPPGRASYLLFPNIHMQILQNALHTFS